MRRGALAWVWLAAAAAGAAPACPPDAGDGTLLAGGGLQVAWVVADTRPIAQGEHFALLVRACPPEAELLAVDATMPAHRHGMNYRPSITPLGPGRWRVEGLMFHMRGAWVLTLDLRHAGRTQTLRQAIDLP